ncbi:MAG TPA: 3-deoxy-D-manno-octulosonic acid transferase, partial [Gammaproteobacteria bacterium]|nr:3-deoxy-D-manno-octulosonic acid transferase [Gammaproteobacteria bacterium]
GPHCFHFMEICDLLVEGGGAIIVSSAVQLSERVCQFLSDERLRYRVGKMARQVVENNRGAVDRVMALLGKHLEQGSRLTR